MYKYLINNNGGDVVITDSFEIICEQAFRKHKQYYDSFINHPDKIFLDEALKKIFSYPNFIVCYSSTQPATKHTCSSKSDIKGFSDMAEYQNDRNEKLIIVTSISCRIKELTIDINHRTLLKESTIAQDVFKKIDKAQRLFLIDEFLNNNVSL